VKTHTTKQLAIAVCAFFAAGAAQAATVYGVDGNDRLVSFDSDAPQLFKTSVQITGASGLLALDFRPLNGALYGLASDRRVYTIDPFTGAATAQSDVLDLGPLSSQFAFDFNPTIDRLRIITNADNNYVFNPNNGALTVATPVFYVAGDVNFGVNPNITSVAYTSSVFGAAPGTTQLYGIDTAANTLVKVANSAGRLETVGSVSGIDVGARHSFDILGSDAFVQDGRNFYAINLATGALTLKGRTDESLFGLAIAQASAPEPATWAMMILGFGFAGASLRQRRRAPVRA